jgi:hypothetical protein
VHLLRERQSLDQLGVTQGAETPLRRRDQFADRLARILERGVEEFLQPFA